MSFLWFFGFRCSSCVDLLLEFFDDLFAVELFVEWSSVVATAGYVVEADVVPFVR